MSDAATELALFHVHLDLARRGVVLTLAEYAGLSAVEKEARGRAIEAVENERADRLAAAIARHLFGGRPVESPQAPPADQSSDRTELLRAANRSAIISRGGRPQDVESN